MRETSRDYAHPYRPLPLRVAHGALAALGVSRWPSLRPDDLIAAARAAEKLHDLGAPDLEPLERMVASIEAEASLNPLGRFATRERLVQVLRNRLRFTELSRRHPEISAVALEPPVVIAGLQRTGTTLLHRLLAADPRVRSLASWEALNPAPFLSGRGDPRPGLARRAEAGLRWLSPDFFAVHPVEADAPEEDVLLLEHAFLSTVAEATLRVPSFSAWLESTDQRPAYVLMGRLLQLLTWQHGPSRWVLKTPHHLEWLDVLWDVFPGATVVMTHRDPLVTAGSFCSMVAHGRGVMSDVVDPAEIGRDWLEKLGRMTDRALDAREARGDRGVIDVRYEALMADPVGTVRRVREAAGLPCDAEADAATQAAMARMPKDRHGAHRYALDDFGLDEAKVRQRLRRWRDRFHPEG
jgi:hypothetical protein